MRLAPEPAAPAGVALHQILDHQLALAAIEALFGQLVDNAVRDPLPRLRHFLLVDAGNHLPQHDARDVIAGRSSLLTVAPAQVGLALALLVVSGGNRFPGHGGLSPEGSLACADAHRGFLHREPIKRKRRLQSNANLAFGNAVFGF